LDEKVSQPGNTNDLDINRPGVALSILRATELAWNKAALGWDIIALSELYTDNALFYGARPGLSVGRDGVLGYFKTYVGALKSATLQLIDQQIIILGPDAFIAQGYGRFEFLSENNNHGTATLRTTWALTRQPETWKITLHHFSLTPEAPPIPD
jgi:ketosteroid isomerase-like protein